MKILTFSSFAAVVLIIAACHSTKKTGTSASSAPVAESAAPVSAATKSSNGVFAPGEDQVNGVKIKHPDATLTALTEGYNIYIGTCTRCHGTKSIYRISEANWPMVIDDMAHKAKLTALEKDALTKYVFAIKSTQPAGK